MLNCSVLDGWWVEGYQPDLGWAIGRGEQYADSNHQDQLESMALYDLLEKQIVPALRAGFVVLTDRYIYSLIARAQVRGVQPKWIRDILGFALVPDEIFYLKIDIDHLLPRVVNSQGFDYWESGMDYLRSDDIYENYVRYQGQLIEQFDAMSKEYHFHVVDANQGVPEVFAELRDAIRLIVEDMQLPADLGGARPAPARKRRNASARPTNASKS